MPRVTSQPTTLYDTANPDKRDGYMAWLMDFSDVAVRLTGTNPIFDLGLGKIARRWFLTGLTPYEAVKRRQQWHARGHVAQVVFPDTCPACRRPNTTVGWRFCARCRES